VGELITAIVVAASLIFVGIQMLQHTRTLKSATVNSIVVEFNDVNITIAANAEIEAYWEERKPWYNAQFREYADREILSDNPGSFHMAGN
jgi:hypothetical protein